MANDVDVKTPVVEALDMAVSGLSSLEPRPVGRTQVLPLSEKAYEPQSRPVVGSTQWSDSVDQLIGALAIAQLAFVEIEKNRKASIKSAKANYSYKYADLSAVMDSIRNPLATNGLVVMQFPTFRDRFVVLETVCFHKSGQWIKNTISMPLVVASPQDIGIVLAYARRYGVSALFALAAGETDNDGHVNRPQAKDEPAFVEDEPAFVKLMGVREVASGGAWVIRDEAGVEYVTDDNSTATVCKKACESDVLVDIQWESRTAKSGTKYRHVIEVVGQEAK